MNLFNMYKRGENLKETLRIDMTKIREKNTNWYATILGFFRDEDTENEQDSGYEEWKKENADIINFPSCHEGFGMPIIEGQAVGRIVVTSNIEPMISVANNGAAICDPYNIESIRNTYIRVINDFQYRNDIILKGIDNVKKYSIETVTKQYFELYKTL